MVDGDDTARLLGHPKHRGHIRNRIAANEEIHKLGGAEQVRVPVECRDLPPWNEQHPIEVRPQFSPGIILRDRVVVRDRNEVKSTPDSTFRGHEDRTGDIVSSLACAPAVTVPAVHVEIAAIPLRFSAQRNVCETRGLSPMPDEINTCLK